MYFVAGLCTCKYHIYFVKGYLQLISKDRYINRPGQISEKDIFVNFWRYLINVSFETSLRSLILTFTRYQLKMIFFM